MDDVLFLALFKDTVEFIDERYGRVAAWLAMLFMFALILGVVASLIYYFARPS